MFLSHVQSTAQDLAVLLWSNLDKEFPGRIFLDVQTDFDIHDLDKIVSKTNLFVLIVSNGLFGRPWCKKGVRLDLILSVIVYFRI